MSWSCGIVGLPNAGKSTLFKALTMQNIVIDSYPFSTVNPNRGIVPLADCRLDSLAKLCNSKKKTPATIEILDVAGLVKGASKGEGLGNQFLGNLRNVDMLIHVVAGYDLGKNNSEKVLKDRVEVINTELCLADLESVFRKVEKSRPQANSGDQYAIEELRVLEFACEQLNRGVALSLCNIAPKNRTFLEPLNLLTDKKMIYVLNVHEDDIHNHDVSNIFTNHPTIVICARLETEIADLSKVDQTIFLKEYKLETPQSLLLLSLCSQSLGLISFYTVKGDEAKSWLVPAGTNAFDVSGKIHSDIMRGFINVEVIHSQGIIDEGSVVAARDKGYSKVEGKEYKVQNGDVLLFRFRS